MAARSKTPATTKSGTVEPARSSGTEIDTFLAKVKAMTPVTGSGRGRLIFAMDATMSRQPTWDLALELQGEMFRAVKEVGGLDVQLVYFRGHGETRASKWVSDPEALARLMRRRRLPGRLYPDAQDPHPCPARKREGQGQCRGLCRRLHGREYRSARRSRRSAWAPRRAGISVPGRPRRECRARLQGDRAAHQRRLLPVRRRLGAATPRASGRRRRLRDRRPQGAEGLTARQRRAGPRCASSSSSPRADQAMPAFLAGLAVLVLLFVGVRLLATANPQKLATTSAQDGRLRSARGGGAAFRARRAATCHSARVLRPGAARTSGGALVQGD